MSNDPTSEKPINHVYRFCKSCGIEFLTFYALVCPTCYSKAVDGLVVGGSSVLGSAFVGGSSVLGSAIVSGGKVK
jgi:hypothetical protein